MLYQHGGSYNHGCEALCTTISSEIKRVTPESHIELCSHHAAQDMQYSIKSIDNIFQNNRWLKRGTWPYFFYQVDKRLFNIKRLQDRIMVDRPCLEGARRSDVCIAIGGDNYCYNKGKIYWPSERRIKKMGKKMMLWGCSIDPEFLPGELARHLRLFDKITARDIYTYEALLANGFTADIVSLVADPAFLLPVEQLLLPPGWIEDKMVGINLSPMILNYTADSDKVVQSVENLISHILENTDFSIALTPHVRLPYTDDMDVLRPLYEKFKATGRVLILDSLDYSASQLKGFISRMRFFIGARTHAIIASYSTGVPALALGYSIKAKGIAKDLFGSYENLVLPVQTFQDASSLTKGFDYLLANETSLKNQLAGNLPAYKERAEVSAEVFKSLLDK